MIGPPTRRAARLRAKAKRHRERQRLKGLCAWCSRARDGEHALCSQHREAQRVND